MLSISIYLTASFISNKSMCIFYSPVCISLTLSLTVTHKANTLITLLNWWIERIYFPGKKPCFQLKHIFQFNNLIRTRDNNEIIKNILILVFISFLSYYTHIVIHQYNYLNNMFTIIYLSIQVCIISINYCHSYF